MKKTIVQFKSEKEKIQKELETSKTELTNLKKLLFQRIGTKKT